MTTPIKDRIRRIAPVLILLAALLAAGSHLGSLWLYTVDMTLNLTTIEAKVPSAKGTAAVLTRDELRSLDLVIQSPQGEEHLKTNVQFSNQAPPIYGLAPTALPKGTYEIHGFGLFKTEKGKEHKLPLQTRFEVTEEGPLTISFSR